MRISDWSSDVCSSDLWNAWPRCAPTTDAIRRASQKHGGCLRCRRPYSDFQTAGENPMSDEDIHAAGMKVRRRILGDAHVDRAVANTTPLNREFQDLLTRYGWGEIWTRPGFDYRTRRILVLGTDRKSTRLNSSH